MIRRLWNNEAGSKSIKTDKVELVFDNIPLSYLRNIQIPLGNTVAMLQDASILSEVQQFIADIPQCTHCWKLAHKYKKCEERNDAINQHKKKIENELKNGEIDEKQKEEKLQKWHIKRYCKKCGKKGHNARDCRNQQSHCAICDGNHASIKSAGCPAVRTLIKLFRNARMMQQDGHTIDSIKGHNNRTILLYDKKRVLGNDNGKSQQLHDLQRKGKSLSPAEVDRGGKNDNNNNKKEEMELKENDSDDDMTDTSKVSVPSITNKESFTDQKKYNTSDEMTTMMDEIRNELKKKKKSKSDIDDVDSDSGVLDKTIDGYEQRRKKRRLNEKGDGI